MSWTRSSRRGWISMPGTDPAIVMGPSFLLGLPEVPQIRRRLLFPRWHEASVSADEITLSADEDIGVVLRAGMFDPVRIALASIFPDDRPRTGQSIVNR